MLFNVLVPALAVMMAGCELVAGYRSSRSEDGAVDVRQTPDIERPADAACAVWNPAWTKRTKLAFRNDKIGEDLVSFSVLLVLTREPMEQLRLKDNAADLRFVDADDRTELDYETESWQPLDTSFVSVKVPRTASGRACSSASVRTGAAPQANKHGRRSGCIWWAVMTPSSES